MAQLRYAPFAVLRLSSMSAHFPLPPALLASLDVTRAASSSSASTRSPLYRDALSSLLSFLSLHEMAVALGVNKEWAAAVQSVRSPLLTARISSDALDALLSSRLRRHVGELCGSDKRTLSLPSNQLATLTYKLPQLHSLSITLRMVNDDAPLLFPLHLQRLDLFLMNSLPDAPANAALVDSISQLRQLHSLHLRLPSHSFVSFTALQQLPLLRDFDLNVSVFPNMEQFASELRALPWLYRLHINILSDFSGASGIALFHALLGEAAEEQTSNLQWRDVNIADLVFTDELTP
jgi:hypothetical protein